MTAAIRRDAANSLLEKPASRAGQYYALFVFAAWVFYAFFRRIIEWRTSGGFALVIDAVPLLLSIAPGVALLRGDWRHINPAMRVLGWCWIGTNGYGFAIGIVSGNGLPTVASFVQFMAPLIFGLWLASNQIATPKTYDRVAEFVLWCAALASVYGIAQYVSPTPWDAAWVIASGLTSIGSPEPFGLRIFSVMSSAAPFADFLVIALLMNLPRLRISPLPLAQYTCCTFALLLTQVRADWIALGVGLLYYVCCTQRRGSVLQNVGAVIAVSVLLSGALPALIGTDRTGQILQQRFDSLNDISNDVSTASRIYQTEETLFDALSRPTGAGLGVLGTSTQVGSTGQTTTLDNGYVGRFLELGYPGLFGYLGTIILALVIAVRRTMLQRSWPAIAGCAIQLALVWLDVSADHHDGFMGIFFWLAVATTLPMVSNKRSIGEHAELEAAAFGPLTRE